MELVLTTVIRFGSIGIGILLIRFFSGINAIDQWGSITMVLAYSSIILLLTQFGQGTNMLNRIKVDQMHIRLVQMNSLLISIGPFLVGCALKNYIPSELYFALLMAPVFVWYKNFSQFFQRKENSKILFSLLNQDSYIQYVLFATVLTLYHTNIPVDYYFFTSLLVLTISPIIYYVIHIKRIKSEFSVIRTKSNLVVSLPFFIASGSGVLLSWMDSLMLGNMHGPEQVGIYNGIFKVSSLVTIALSLLNSYVAPRIRDSFIAGGADLKNLVRPYNRIGLVVSIMSYVGIVFLGPFIFELLKLPYSTELYHCLLILAFGYVVNAAVGNVGFLLQLTNNQKIFNRIVFSALLLNIILNLLLIPKYGIFGAAVASTLTMSIWNVLSYFAVKIKLGFSPI